MWEKIEHSSPKLFADAMTLNPTGRMARPTEMEGGRVPGQSGHQLHHRAQSGRVGALIHRVQF